MNSTGNLLDSLISYNDGAVVRQVAQRFGNVAAFSGQQVGLDDSILEQMLPMPAAAGMGMLAKQVASRGQSGAIGQSEAAPDMMGMLNSILDTNKDGSSMDDILGLAQRFFQRR